MLESVRPTRGRSAGRRTRVALEHGCSRRAHVASIAGEGAGKPGMCAREPRPSASREGRYASPSAAMSIDVEDWFQVDNLKGVVARASWALRESRVERITERLLELMQARDVRATFFVLGWLAARVPGLVRQIAAAGHEVATHGHGHDLVYDLSPQAFREDVRRSVGLLEDAVGSKVRGYRAPSFSITDWAPAILQELGLEYNSSLLPSIAHDRYGRLNECETSAPIFEIARAFTRSVSARCASAATISRGPAAAISG